MGKQLLTLLRLIARMNFSLKNYSCELLYLTGTVGKVELISTFTTAVCESWNVSDKYTWDNAGDLKLQLHDAIYQLRFYSNSLIHILSLSNSHNNVASIQKNRGDKSHRVIVALDSYRWTRLSVRIIGAIKRQFFSQGN